MTNAIAALVAQNEVAQNIIAQDKAAAAAPKAAKATTKKADSKAAQAKLAAAIFPEAKVEQAAPAKADSKADNKAKARTVRPAQKPVEKKVSAVAKAAPLIAIKYRIFDGARPSAGRFLFAHTQAIIDLLDLTKTSAPREILNKVMGASAVSYHLKKGTMQTNENGITLSAFGINFFNGRIAKRELDEQDVKDFKEILTSGTANRVCKNQTNIGAM